MMIVNTKSLAFLILCSCLAACSSSTGSRNTDEDAGTSDGGAFDENNGNRGVDDDDTDQGDAGVDGGTGNGNGPGGDGSNRPPEVVDVERTTDEDTPITEELQGFDPDDDELSYEITREPDHGTLTINGNEVTYTPDEDFNGEDSFDFAASDGQESAEGTVTIIVNPVNDPPVVDDLAFTIDEGEILNPAESLVEAAMDPDGDGLSVVPVAVERPTQGTLGIEPDGTFTYQHTGESESTDSFVFEVCDDSGLCAEGSVEITINLVDDPPVVEPDNYAVQLGGTLNVAVPGVLNNDHDPEGAPLIVETTPIAAPSNGSLTLNADGSFSYTHTNTSVLSDQFEYRACDPENQCGTALVTISIQDPTTPPVARNDRYSVAEGDTFASAPLSVMDNDTNPGGLAVVITTPVSSPSHGTLSLSANGTFIYAHDGTESRTDSFVYRLCDPAQQCSSASVTLDIELQNEDPIAEDDEYTLEEGATLEASSVLANDEDPDGQTLQSTLLTPPSHGSLVLRLDGTFTYQHDDTETPTDSFTYEACDNLGACDSATVTLGIDLIDESPIAVNDSYAVVEGTALNATSRPLTANDIEPDGEQLIVTTTPVTPPATGSLTLNADGTFTYQHTGLEMTDATFRYEVCDPNGNCDEADVTISAVPSNDPPQAADDEYSIEEGGTLVVAAAGVLLNDTDPDSATLLLTQIIDMPSNGTVDAFAEDGSFTYTHDDSDTTSDSFTYQVCDLLDACDTGTVNLTITPVGDAVADGFAILGNTERAGSVTANDSFAGGAPVAACPCNQAQDGYLFDLQADGSYTFLPPVGDRSGSHTVRYQLKTDAAEVCGCPDPASTLDKVGEVTFTISQEMVWFVDPDASPNDSDGRDATQGVSYGFSDVSSLINGVTAQAGDLIAVYGRGNACPGTPLDSAGIELPSGVSMIGEALNIDQLYADLPLVYGAPEYSYFDFGGTVPTPITGTVNAVRLTSNNLLAGFDICDTGSDAITGTFGVDSGQRTVIDTVDIDNGPGDPDTAGGILLQPVTPQGVITPGVSSTGFQALGVAAPADAELTIRDTSVDTEDGPAVVVVGGPVKLNIEEDQLPVTLDANEGPALAVISRVRSEQEAIGRVVDGVVAQGVVGIPTSGLIQHLAGEDLVGAQGSPITTWPARAGNNATSSGIFAPTVALNAIGGKPAARFDGVLSGPADYTAGEGDYMDLGDGFDDFSNGLTAFVVARASSIPPESRRIFALGNLQSDPISLGTGNDLPSLVYFTQSESGVTSSFNSSSVVKPTEAAVFAVSHGGGMPNEQVLATITKNGSPVGTGDVYVPEVINRAANLLGTSWYNEPFAGDIAEFIIYDRQLSSAEMNDVEAYLQGKYLGGDIELNAQITSVSADYFVPQIDVAQVAQQRSFEGGVLLSGTSGSLSVSQSSSFSNTAIPAIQITNCTACNDIRFAGSINVNNTATAQGAIDIANSTGRFVFEGGDGDVVGSSVGVYLNNTQNVELSALNIAGGNYGITGRRVHNLAVKSVNVDSSNIEGLSFPPGNQKIVPDREITGLLSIADSTFTGSGNRNVSIENATGVLQVDIQNTGITGCKLDGLFVSVSGDATTSLDMQGSSVNANGRYGWVSSVNSETAALEIVAGPDPVFPFAPGAITPPTSPNTFQGNGDHGLIAVAEEGSLDLALVANVFVDNGLSAIYLANVAAVPGSGLNGFVQSNDILGFGATNGEDLPSNGIFIEDYSPESTTLDISGNRFAVDPSLQSNSAPNIQVDLYAGLSEELHAHLTHNTFTNVNEGRSVDIYDWGIGPFQTEQAPGPCLLVTDNAFATTTEASRFVSQTSGELLVEDPAGNAMTVEEVLEAQNTDLTESTIYVVYSSSPVPEGTCDDPQYFLSP